MTPTIVYLFIATWAVFSLISVSVILTSILSIRTSRRQCYEAVRYYRQHGTLRMGRNGNRK